MKNLILTISIFALTAAQPATIYAESVNLEITANGAESASEINVDNSTQSEVVQQNQADVTNQVETEANTGDNQANTNTGSQVSIETGDVTTATQIQNQTNANDLTLDTCCQEDSATHLTIAANGAQSQNQFDTTQATQITAVQTNNLVINNVIITHANTGDNQANDNTSSQVNIDTGDINHQVSVENTGNTQSSQISSNKPTLIATIKKNGANSANIIQVTESTTIDSQTFNTVIANNYLKNKLNTGGNQINGNTKAKIGLTTGNIFSTISVKNFFNQIASVIDNCCQNGTDDPGDNNGDPDGPEDNNGDGGNGNHNGDPGGNGNGSGKGDGNGGGTGGGGNGDSNSSDDGTGNGYMLPATGLNSVFLTLNTLLFLLGTLLVFKPWNLFFQDFELSFSISI